MNVQIDISPIIDEEDGEMRGVMLSFIDITELALTKERAEEASRSKSSFLANMSHEIRTPMNAIKGLAELLMMTELNDLQQAYVSNIVNSSNSLLTIINDILDFSKIDANKIDIIKSEYKLATILKDVCSVIHLHAQEKNLEFIIDIDPEIPSRFYGDDSRIKQVMLNILGNAVKYTEKGSVTFKVSSRHIDDKNIRLDFSVKDTGIGIKQSELASLFEAFTRADLRLNRSILGTGLGLAISKNLMLAMGGDVEVQSTYGEGSVFSFWLPQRVTDSSPVAAVEYAGKKKVLLFEQSQRTEELAAVLNKLGVPHVNLKTTRDQGLPGWEDASHCIYYDGCDLSRLGKLRGSMPEAVFVVVRDIRRALEQPKFANISLYEPVLVTDVAEALNKDASQSLDVGLVGHVGDFKVRDAKALVVDDNDLNLMVGGEILRSFGFEVAEATGGEEAVAACLEEKFDIIFMDHMMPVMDGIEAAMHIREAPGKNLKTPVIALTANVVSGMREYFLRCGMDDVVSKPIEVAELGRVIISWLPEQKIIKEGSAVTAEAERLPQNNELDLVTLLDDFGMYANDVMRELNGDLQTFIARLGHAEVVLGDMVTHLNEVVRLEDWPRFSRIMGDLKELLHGVGARDCAVRAKKMEISALEGNIDYVRQDFKSLMGNMYMLERKLNALVPLAMGKRDKNYTPNDTAKILEFLEALKVALYKQDAVVADENIEELARCSFDHDLDMQLNQVRWAMEDGDFEQALQMATAALSFYKRKIEASMQQAENSL